MNALPLLAEFLNKGVAVRIEGSELVVSASRGALTESLLARVRAVKPTLIADLDYWRKRSISDWPADCNGPEELETFFQLLQICKMREQGYVPDHYTALTTCKRCGRVPIWAGCPPQILGCPWCFNRLKGFPMPITR